MSGNQTALVKKLETVGEPESSGNVSATAIWCSLQPLQVQKWRKTKEFAGKSPTYVTVHPSRKLDILYIDNMVFDWIMEQRRAELDVSTHDTIDKAVSIDPKFIGRDEKKRIYWVFRFMLRKHLLYEREIVSVKALRQ